MTGTIVALASRSRTGMIRTQDGAQLVFSAAAVIGDFDSLAIGHRVSFDVERSCHTAVRVFREPVGSNIPGKKADALPDLRYTGFDQAANLRSYGFDAVTYGHSVHYCVTVDVTLLLKHHIGVQEVPALCLHKLAADLKDYPNSARHQLGDDDLVAFASSRTATLQRRRPKHSFVGRRGSPPAPGPSPDRRAP